MYNRDGPYADYNSGSNSLANLDSNDLSGLNPDIVVD